MHLFRTRQAIRGALNITTSSISSISPMLCALVDYDQRMWDVQLHELTVNFRSRWRLIRTHKLTLCTGNIDRTDTSSLSLLFPHILINIIYTFLQTPCMEGDWSVSQYITRVTEGSAQLEKYKARSANEVKNGGWVENIVRVAHLKQTERGKKIVSCWWGVWGKGS